MTTEKKGDGKVAVYAPKSFKLNTGKPTVGVAGILDIPAGMSRLDAEYAAHPWVKLHTTERPDSDIAASEAATMHEAEVAALKARVATVEGERDEALATVRGQADELDGLRLALNQSPDERLKALEVKLAAAQAEAGNLRAELAKARQSTPGKK
jgi:hypothetical protein